MFILSAVGNAAVGVASTVVTTFSPSMTRLVYDNYSTLSQVARDTMRALGYIQSARSEESQHAQALTPTQAFDAAQQLPMDQIVQAQKYYDIVFESKDANDKNNQFAARCRLACMYAQVQDDLIPAEVDDRHGVSLNKAKKVNQLIGAAYEQNPTSNYLLSRSDETKTMLAIAGGRLRNMIRSAMASFENDHKTFSFEQYPLIKERWQYWEMIIRSYNTHSSWWKTLPGVEHSDEEVITIDVSILRISLSHVFVSEIKRLETLYKEQQDQVNFNGKVLYDALHAVNAKKSEEPALNTAGRVINAYEALLHTLALRIATDLYAMLKEKSEAAQQGKEARETLIQIKAYLEEANACKTLEGGALNLMNEVLRKISCLDLNAALSDPEQYLAQCASDLGERSLYLIRKANPEDILAQMAWLKEKDKILNKLKEQKPSLDVKELKDLLFAHQYTKGKAFKEAIENNAEALSESWIETTLAQKRLDCRGVKAGIMMRDTSVAQLEADHRAVLKQAIMDIVSDPSNMTPFYSMPKDEMTKRVNAVQQLMMGQYTYGAYNNVFSLRNNIVDKAVINTIIAELKGPDPSVTKKKTPATN